MMYVGVVKFGNTNLIFIDPAGLKLTSRTAGRYVLLTEQLLPAMREFFELQQDSVSVQSAFWNGRHQFSFHQTCGSQKVQI